MKEMNTFFPYWNLSRGSEGKQGPGSVREGPQAGAKFKQIF